MNLFAEPVVDTAVVEARNEELHQLVFPHGLPSNIVQLVNEAGRNYALGSEWSCVVACRSVLERAVMYLSRDNGYSLGMRPGSSLNEMLKRAHYLQLISQEAHRLGRMIWEEGSGMNHWKYVSTTRPIHILEGLGRILFEIAPHLKAPPTTCA